MANAFNFAKFCKEQERGRLGESLKSVYKTLYVEMIHKDSRSGKSKEEIENDFEKFYEESLNSGKEINGDSFHLKIEETLFNDKEFILNSFTEEDRKELRTKLNEDRKKDGKEPISEEEFSKEVYKEAKKKRIKVLSSSLLETSASVGLSEKELAVYKMALAQSKDMGFLPWDTGLAAGMTIAKGNNLQQGCGQGKTNGMAFGVYAERMAGKQVSLTSSTADLAKQSYEESVNFYKQLGVADKMFLLTLEGPKVKKDGKLVDVCFKIENGNVEIVPEGQGQTLGQLTKEQKSLAMQLIYGDKESIIVSDNATMAQHFMDGYIPTMGEDDRVALMDEADYVKLDQFHQMQDLGEEYGEQQQAIRENLRVQAREIIKEIIKDKDNFNKEMQHQAADFTSVGTTKVKAKIDELYNNGKHFDRELLFRFCKEALVVETVFVNNVDYSVGSNGEITSTERASGTEIELPQGIQQALEVKIREENSQAKYTPERIVKNLTTIRGAMDNIFGHNQRLVSGTIGKSAVGYVEVLNRTVAKEAPDNAAYDNKRQTAYLGAEGYQEKAETLLKSSMKGALESERPVLIGCVSSQDIQELEKTLAIKDDQGKSEASDLSSPVRRNMTVDGKTGVTVIVDTAESNKRYLKDRETLSDEKFKEIYGVSIEQAPKKFDDYIKHFSGKSNTLILGTSIVGRGANIKLNKGQKINDKGGLHVIAWKLHPSSVRQMIQMMNRAGRGDENGSSLIISTKDDLDYLPEGERPKVDAVWETDSNGVPLQTTEQMTSEQQEALKAYEDHFERADDRNVALGEIENNFETAVREGIRDIRNTLKEGTQTSEYSVLLATSMFLSRAQEFKFSTTGISDEKTANSYRETITAFAHYYVEMAKEGFDHEKVMGNLGEIGDKIKGFYTFSADMALEAIALYGDKITPGLNISGVSQKDIEEARRQIVSEEKANQGTQSETLLTEEDIYQSLQGQELNVEVAKIIIESLKAKNNALSNASSKENIEKGGE